MSKLPYIEGDKVFSKIGTEMVLVGQIEFNEDWKIHVFRPALNCFFGPIFLHEVALTLEVMDNAEKWHEKINDGVEDHE